jgi:hypothetical protein
MTPVAPLITDFLREHMPRQRGYSPLSCESYAHGFKLLFAFAAKRLHTRPSQLSSSISKLTWCPIRRIRFSVKPSKRSSMLCEDIFCSWSRRLRWNGVDPARYYESRRSALSPLDPNFFRIPRFGCRISPSPARLAPRS